MISLVSYRGFAERRTESLLYGVLQRRFMGVPKECDLVTGQLLWMLDPGGGHTRRLLDVGCGNGQLVAHLHERLPNWKLSGIDLREDAIREAQTFVGSNFELVDLFGYDPGSLLDAIVCQSVTYSFTDDQFERALENFRGWLKPGGLVILFDSFTPWEQHLTVIEKALHHPDGHPITVRPYSQLRRVASSSGLEVLEIRPFTYTGGQHWQDPHDLRSYNEGGFTMRGCFNQTQAHAVLVAV